MATWYDKWNKRSFNATHLFENTQDHTNMYTGVDILVSSISSDFVTVTDNTIFAAATLTHTSQAKIWASIFSRNYSKHWKMQHNEDKPT